MKRSEINAAIRNAEKFFAANGFRLPPFAAWSPEDWKNKGPEIAEILDCELGWDVTDFGRGDYAKAGLFLFTVRNGRLGSKKYPKPYAEKIMISLEDQITLLHYHRHKTEDIINRAGGRLVFEVYNSRNGNDLDRETPVILQRDGVRTEVRPGSHFTTGPGESVTLTPGIFHAFWAEKGSGPVMIGEVSAVNDDHTDNVFYEPQLRFPEIEEDEVPYHLLVCDYGKLSISP